MDRRQFLAAVAASSAGMAAPFAQAQDWPASNIRRVGPYPPGGGTDVLARALADKIAANPGAVMRMTKRLLREGEHSTLESLLELSAGYQALAHKTADHREAVMAFVEKRKPRFQ